jgi:DNA-binding response OmpR family regulator
MSVNRVLCVEDDADTRTVLKMLLELIGVESVGVTNVDAALRLMEDERFGLYILDGGLPGINELSPCAQIRAADSRTPIVIFSGYALPSDIVAGMLSGANAYILKPDINKIVPTVKRLLAEAAAPLPPSKSAQQNSSRPSRTPVSAFH